MWVFVYLLGLRTLANEFIKASEAGLMIKCQENQENSSVVIDNYSGWSFINGTSWVWFDSFSLHDEDTCMISGIDIEIAENPNVYLLVSADQAATLFVNDIKTEISGINSESVYNFDVTNYFPNSGSYKISFEVKTKGQRAGITYKFIEKYSCESSCMACTISQCLQCSITGGVISGNSCICPENSYLSNGVCMCNRGFILGSKSIYCVECEFEDNCDYSFALYIDVGIEEYKTPDIDIQIGITSDDDFIIIPTIPSNVHIFYYGSTPQFISEEEEPKKIIGSRKSSPYIIFTVLLILLVIFLLIFSHESQKGNPDSYLLS